MRSVPKTASVTEIFSSIQGEGPRMGERHIFIRFGACHMACAYCDEASKKSRLMPMADILARVDNLEGKYGPHSCVSLTGGEPLLYADVLKSLCGQLRKRKFQVLLESSGILWRQLSKVIRDCDIISMDLKLPSVTRQKDFCEEHRRFLRIARRKDVYIKVVISARADVREWERHIRMVASVARETPVFLQPMSRPGESYPDLSLMRFLNKWQRIGAKRLSDVRVGIQLHKILNIR